MLTMLPLREALEALPLHPISGYEWDCEDCEYWWVDDPRWGDTRQRNEGMHDSDGIACDHRRLVDLDRVLALLRDAHE